MEGWMHRLFATLVIAVVVLLVAFIALALGLTWQAVTVMALTLFAAMVTVQLVVEMRRDVRMLKNQALELAGYESEIGRRVDYLASLVERSGGAAPDELAKRVRSVNQQYADVARRLEGLEREVAELAIAGPAKPPVAVPVARPKVAQAKAGPAKVEPMTGEPTTVEPAGPVKTETEAEAQSTARPPAAIIPLPRPQPKTGPTTQAEAVPRASPAHEPAPKPGRARNDAHRWREAVASDRLAFHLVPLLALPERTPTLYQAVMRLREGDGWLEPEALARAVAPHGLGPMLERKTLYSAAQMLRSVRRLGKDMRLLAPLSSSSLADERGFAELRAFFEAAPDLRDRLILEIGQAPFRALASEARQRIGLVADAGFELSMGDLVDLKTDPQTLRQLGFTLVRAPAMLLTANTDDTEGTSFAVALASHRIDLAATGVGDDETLLALVDRDVALAQGPALSPPRLVKPDLLQPTPARTASAGAASAPASAAQTSSAPSSSAQAVAS